MVVEGLDVGENTHGVWFTTHDHHVVHLNQPVAACLRSGGEAGDKNRLLQMQHDIYIYLNKIFIVIIINNSNIFKLNTMPIKGGQIHLYKKAFPCSFHLSGTEE